ncbi:MAG: radical SAM protein [Candidatus Omnitrophica bacterium]|nr:radical SAM protein [Candidatus Omnitrophota bacterium]
MLGVNNKLVLDGTKISWHQERLRAWEQGARFAPITIDMSLTRACNYKCVYCYSTLQENKRGRITIEVMRRFLDDCAEIGVKGISFVSDGESSLSPAYAYSIKYGHNKGISMASGTNGYLLGEEMLRQILPCLTYLRFNITAAEPKRYQEIMGAPIEAFCRVKENIKKAVAIKKEKNLPVTIGMQMVLMPQFRDQILPLARLGKELRPDYLVIKHCSDDEFGALGVNYKGYKELYDTLKEAEALSDQDYLVKVKWSKIESEGKRDYERCFGPPFLLQISGSGLVAPCGCLFNERYKKYHIGNFIDTPFKEIVFSDRYWEVMEELASERFNAKTMCGTLCVQHKVNEALDKYKKGLIEIKEPATEPPPHINFI